MTQENDENLCLMLTRDDLEKITLALRMLESTYNDEMGEENLDLDAIADMLETLSALKDACELVLGND